LQRGLQFNLEFKGDRAAFLRVYERGDARQTALVLLNKGESETRFEIDRWLSRGTWRDASNGEAFVVTEAGGALAATVAAHGVRVLFFDGRNTDAGLAAELGRAVQALRPASVG
jgi:cyclomaltodextrin glucanotransferase